MAATNVKYNDILLNLIPNPQYVEINASDNDPMQKKVVSLNSNQIVSLEIMKAFADNQTEIILNLDNIDQTTGSIIMEGKYLFQLIITPFDPSLGSSAGFKGNFFLATDTTVTGTTTQIGTYPTQELSITLVSLFRMRLGVENNIPFELGGRGEGGPLGSKVPPFAFLADDFAKLLKRTYSPNDIDELLAPISFFNMDLTSTDEATLVKTGPDSGYKLEVDTNFEAIDFFLENYPLYKTPFGWMLDDFNTNPNSPTPSSIVVKDLMRHDIWKRSVDVGLSKILNAEIEPTTSNSKEEQALLHTYSMVNIAQINRSSIYNTGIFMFKHNLPLIFARRIFDNQIINTKGWNNGAETHAVLCADNVTLKIKNIPNPRYQEYVTFMNGEELTQIQKYKNIFFNLHPDLVTYSLNNLWVGDIDIHKCIYFKKPTTGADYHLPRVGTGYEMHFKYDRSQPTEATLGVDTRQHGMPNKSASSYQPKFILGVEATFLMIDEGPLSIKEFDALERTDKFSTEEKIYTVQDLSDAVMCGQNSPIDFGGIPNAEPGSPGNTNIAASAKTLIDHGFAYKLGTERADLMDCSAFTMYAVRNAGADAGRKTKFPNGTMYQVPWLTNPANKVLRVTKIEDLQPGDIIYFKNSKSAFGHAGIAKNNKEYYNSTSVKAHAGDKYGIGAAVGTFARKRPSYMFRILPIESNPTQPKYTPGTPRS